MYLKLASINGNGLNLVDKQKKLLQIIFKHNIQALYLKEKNMNVDIKLDYLI